MTWELRGLIVCQPTLTNFARRPWWWWWPAWKRLPSIVGGYVRCPVIAVPTSVGYGASFGGIAALLGMLNSCAANVTVVNIDAGFKAGYLAGLIASRTRSGAEFETTAET